MRVIRGARDVDPASRIGIPLESLSADPRLHGMSRQWTGPHPNFWVINNPTLNLCAAFSTSVHGQRPHLLFDNIAPPPDRSYGPGSEQKVSGILSFFKSQVSSEAGCCFLRISCGSTARGCGGRWEMQRGKTSGGEMMHRRRRAGMHEVQCGIAWPGHVQLHHETTLEKS